MERLLAESETPFTDFRVVNSDGLPKAVFDRLPEEQGSLLSHFLYPDREYAGAMYLDAMKVYDKEAAQVTYKDDLLAVTIRPRSVVIETQRAAGQAGERVKVRFSLREAKLLLLKWKFECMRWEALQRIA
jgi:hypothetical protein